MHVFVSGSRLHRLAREPERLHAALAERQARRRDDSPVPLAIWEPDAPASVALLRQGEERRRAWRARVLHQPQAGRLPALWPEEER